MTRPAFQRPQAITRRENHTAAFMKVATAPLATLTPAMLESIAASHARRGSPDFARLFASLSQQIADRRARETRA